MSVSASFLCFHFCLWPSSQWPYHHLVVSVGILPEFSPAVFIIPKHLREWRHPWSWPIPISARTLFWDVPASQPPPWPTDLSTPSVSIYLTSGNISGMNLVRTCGHYLLFKVVFEDYCLGWRKVCFCLITVTFSRSKCHAGDQWNYTQCYRERVLCWWV